MNGYETKVYFFVFEDKIETCHLPVTTSHSELYREIVFFCDETKGWV